MFVYVYCDPVKVSCLPKEHFESSVLNFLHLVFPPIMAFGPFYFIVHTIPKCAYTFSKSGWLWRPGQVTQHLISQTSTACRCVQFMLIRVFLFIHKADQQTNEGDQNASDFLFTKNVPVLCFYWIYLFIYFCYILCRVRNCHQTLMKMQRKETCQMRTVPMRWTMTVNWWTEM